MKEQIVDWKNRSNCGDLRDNDINKTTVLYGWVDTIRDHGHLLFMHLRDRSGDVQLVINEENQALYTLARSIRPEYVLEVHATIAERSDETKNPAMPTGKVEALVEKITILSQSQTPPFMISEKKATQEEAASESFNVDEDLRLKYRYLDLRRKSMQDNFIHRYRLTKIIRDYLDEQGFVDVETPVLTKSTPEGARDYLVPSRLHDSSCYALPQSPQLFKQLLMVSGFEKY